MFSVGVINGTDAEERGDTVFVIGKHEEVEQYLIDNNKNNTRTEIFITDKEYIFEAESEFVRKYGTYNNFDYHKVILGMTKECKSM